MANLMPSFLNISLLTKSVLNKSLFRTRALVDQTTEDFIFSTVAWALHNFDHDEFFQRTRLVEPTNEFFPGRVNSVHEKAQNIFQHTLRYSGLSHWPFELKSMIEYELNSECQLQPQPQPELEYVHRNSAIELPVPIIMTEQPLFIFYNPQQTLKPEDLSASYAHVIAQHLMIQKGLLPPGGNRFFAEASEILASIMGFGVLLSNSAYTFRGGCGSCYNAMANRQPALTELDNVFVLALFSRLKGIRYTQATRHLKKHLRPSFKRAVKQIDRRLAQVNDFKMLKAGT